LTREITLTEQANADFEKGGHIEGHKFGEEYLRVLTELAAAEGLRIG